MMEEKSGLINSDGVILSPWRLGWKSFKRDKIGMAGALMVLSLIAVSLFGSYLLPYTPLEMIYQDSFKGPSATHFMGTDRFGRDQFSRIIAGTQTSMAVSFGTVAISTILGVLIGLISGYFGGRTDSIVMRILDVVFAFPTIFLAVRDTGILRAAAGLCRAGRSHNIRGG